MPCRRNCHTEQDEDNCNSIVEKYSHNKNTFVHPLQSHASKISVTGTPSPQWQTWSGVDTFLIRGSVLFELTC